MEAVARTDDVMVYTQTKIKAQQMFTDVSIACVLLSLTHFTLAAAVKESSAYERLEDAGTGLIHCCVVLSGPP